MPKLAGTRAHTHTHTHDSGAPAFHVSDLLPSGAMPVPIHPAGGPSAGPPACGASSWEQGPGPLPREDGVSKVPSFGARELRGEGQGEGKRCNSHRCQPASSPAQHAARSLPAHPPAPVPHHARIPCARCLSPLTPTLT